MVAKKQLVEKIKALLDRLNIIKDGCANINQCDIMWVSRTQVLKRKCLSGNLFRNKRYPLYSKQVTKDELELILSNLESQKENESN